MTTIHPTQPAPRNNVIAIDTKGGEMFFRETMNSSQGAVYVPNRSKALKMTDEAAKQMLYLLKDCHGQKTAEIVPA